MLAERQSAVRWLVSLGGRLVRVVPAFTLYSVIATLVSQVALLLAFLLPLKVILLLGSDGIPAYFPSQFQLLDRQTLILGLSGIAVLLFLLHLLAERVIAACVAAGARKLLLRSRKMTLFENQDEMATKSYQRFARGLASLSFLGFSTPLLLWLNPRLGLVFIAYVMLVIAGCWFGATLREDFRTSWIRITSLLAGCGFLICFSYMVAEFLWMLPPSVLVAVICLLLVRQAFRHVVSAAVDLWGMTDKRRQLSALFFHGQRLVESPRHAFEGVWSLIELADRNRWLRQVLSEVTGRECEVSAVRWLQLGINDVIGYRVIVHAAGEENCFLVKVYADKRSAWAKHEATLLTTKQRLPSLQFIGATAVDDRYHCHVFLLGDAEQVYGKELNACNDILCAKLLCCEPDEQLQTLFLRSKPTLIQRLDKDVLKRMYYLFADTDYLEALRCFEEYFDSIRGQVGSLPMVFVNPDNRRGLIFQNEGGEVAACHWARWSLEPVGSGWPVNLRGLASLEEGYAAAVAQRKDMAEVSLAQVKLAALLFAFESRSRQHDYVGAADLLETINKVFTEELGDIAGPKSFIR